MKHSLYVMLVKPLLVSLLTCLFSAVHCIHVTGSEGIKRDNPFCSLFSDAIDTGVRV